MIGAVATALAPVVTELIAYAARAAQASKEQEAAMLKAALEYIRNLPQPKDATLASDYDRFKEGALESPPMTLDDSDVESDRDPYASDR